MYIDFNQHKDKKLKTVLLSTLGISFKTCKHLFAILGCDFTCKIIELTEQQKKDLIFCLTNSTIITNKLIKKNYEDLSILKLKNNYKNIRHIYKLPANGQNTHNNAKTVKMKKSI